MALISIAQELSVLAAADPAQEPLTDETQTPKSGKAKRRHKGHGQWAPKRMSSLRQRLERASRAGDLPGADLGDIHRMRLQAKQVRYAAEILSDLLPKKSTSALAKRAIKIQKKIGDDRDLQQVVSSLSALDLEPTLRAFFGGVLAARNSSIDAALKSKK
jgi:CHAD domain-containing protein